MLELTVAMAQNRSVPSMPFNPTSFNLVAKRASITNMATANSAHISVAMGDNML